MYSKFLEGITGKLSEQWVTNLLTPAFIFWLGGLAACVYRFGWQTLKPWVLYQQQATQVSLLIVGLIVTATSAAIVQKFDRAMLRCLEGYWPRWMQYLRQKCIQRYVDRWKHDLKRWKVLYSKGVDNLTPVEFDEYTQLDWQIVHSPSKPNQFMPTRLGNLLRAAEYRSRERYGLDAVVCWPRLWLLLPDNTRKDFQEASTVLNTGVRNCLWSLLFLVWTPLAWWSPLLAIMCAYFSYRWALFSAAVYVDLLEATFDVHRNLLYRSLRQQSPKNPTTETEDGEKLTEYLWRGPVSAMPDFYDPLEKGDEVE